MSKVLLIGIDALDFDLLDKFKQYLPNFRRIIEKGGAVRSTSVSPPDSNTAWASIYMGQDPSKHGIVHFMDPLDRISAVANKEIDNSVFRGKTFWDLAGEHGKKVCILFPHLGYPVWPINGVMFGRSAFKNDAEIRTFPNELANRYDLSKLNVIPGFAGAKSHFDEYINCASNLIDEELKLSLQVMNDFEWDLFFTYSSVLDTICHNFWNYCDEDDPTYEDNPYKETIKNFYKKYDNMVGKFIDNIDSDTTVFIFSDHGHGMRPVKLVNINEFLRTKGLLVSRSSRYGGNSIFLAETVKKAMIGFICKYNLGSSALKVLKLFPSSKKLYTYPLSIDLLHSSAYVLDLSGIKAYSYGGIKIIKENITNDGYEDFRNALIKDLLELKNPATGENLILWASKREKLYDGPHTSKYPDIVFQLDENYGAGNAVHVPLITKTNTHSVVPGSHKMYSSIFIIYNAANNRLENHMSILDIAPTVLSTLGVNTGCEFDGKSILQ